MQLRWAIGIALWTLLSGPVFTPPPAPLTLERPVAAHPASPR
jgi:hypothetical protein